MVEVRKSAKEKGNTYKQTNSHTYKHTNTLH